MSYLFGMGLGLGLVVLRVWLTIRRIDLDQRIRRIAMISSGRVDSSAASR